MSCCGSEARCCLMNVFTVSVYLLIWLGRLRRKSAARTRLSFPPWVWHQDKHPEGEHSVLICLDFSNVSISHLFVVVVSAQHTPPWRKATCSCTTWCSSWDSPGTLSTWLFGSSFSAKVTHTHTHSVSEVDPVIIHYNTMSQVIWKYSIIPVNLCSHRAVMWSHVCCTNSRSVCVCRSNSCSLLQSQFVYNVSLYVFKDCTFLLFALAAAKPSSSISLACYGLNEFFRACLCITNTEGRQTQLAALSIE